MAAFLDPIQQPGEPRLSPSWSDDAIIESWCAAQLQSWMGRDLDKQTVIDRYKQMNAQNSAVSLYHFQGPSVRLEEKPTTVPSIPHQAILAARANAFLLFFAETARTYPLMNEAWILLDLEDHPFAYDDLPVFAFQKDKESNLLLVPETDAVGQDFYRQPQMADPYDYASKRTRAIFVGSTFGANHTVYTVKNLSDARLRAGVFFKKHEEVEFRLPSIVQYEDDEAKAAIQALGFGRGPASWKEQFANKFLISMDGNGATCSRVAIALSSNSILLKYRSNRKLYYFSSLIPWLHYVPINYDEEVLHVVRHEARNAGAYEYVANAGAEFFKRYLSKEIAMRYAATLVNRFSDLLDARRGAIMAGGVAPPPDYDITVSSKAHVACVGDVYLDGNRPWIGMLGRGLALEAFAISAESNKMGDCHLQYRIFSDSSASAWRDSGEQVGVPGINNRMQGLEIRLCGGSELVYEATLEVSFVSHSIVSANSERGVVKVVGDLPIESFRLSLNQVPAPPL